MGIVADGAKRAREAEAVSRHPQLAAEIGRARGLRRLWLGWRLRRRIAVERASGPVSSGDSDYSLYLRRNEPTRWRIASAILAALLVSVFLGWTVFAIAGGRVEEIRRGWLDARSMPWPSTEVSGRIVDARAWEGELSSVELTVIDQRSAVRTLILNDSSDAAWMRPTSMPALVGRSISAEVKRTLPLTDEYFVLTARLSD